MRSETACLHMVPINFWRSILVITSLASSIISQALPRLWYLAAVALPLILPSTRHAQYPARLLVGLQAVVSSVQCRQLCMPPCLASAANAMQAKRNHRQKLPQFSMPSSALCTSGRSSTATTSPSMALFMATRPLMRISSSKLSVANRASKELKRPTRSVPCRSHCTSASSDVALRFTASQLHMLRQAQEW